MNRKELLIIIVTHNSEKFTEWQISYLEELKKDSILIRYVDSGSENTEYLKKMECETIQVIYSKNVGFAKANNLALFDVERFKYVLFLNPDAVIYKDDLYEIIKRANTEDRFKNVGIFSVPLIKYDFNNNKATDQYDSLGIRCDLSGRWIDIRDLKNKNKYEAICGAFMFCRSDALIACKNSSDTVGFEESFVMYKEDIELSLRIKKQQWGVHIFNELKAFHCRGWGKKWGENPLWARLYSARNDIYIALKYKKRALPFSLFKYFVVKLEEIIK
ncbi:MULTISPECIES: glycosyltransferase [Klebsiella pneumoniae complex]|uniref:glycosyltransferase n=1 Tax=Klebsiella pneumoniae complex TaxID=3390273 RepID=UPI001FCA7575|nr:glycosyltransferase [Klebsiella variicola]MCJ6069331.1 glycosyltransferase [Klebsiella variicola]HDK6468043.1 glycosyltransferase [Klebsiella variicola]HDT0379486.1 glycosyltransferase [Klebsiella variicola]